MTNKGVENDLKPCPFCGRVPRMDVWVDGNNHPAGCSIYCPNDSCVLTRTNTPNGHPMFPSQIDAIKAWNRRRK